MQRVCVLSTPPLTGLPTLSGAPASFPAQRPTEENPGVRGAGCTGMWIGHFPGLASFNWIHTTTAALPQVSQPPGAVGRTAGDTSGLVAVVPLLSFAGVT